MAGSNGGNGGGAKDSLHVSRSAERALALLALTVERGPLPLVRAAEAAELPASTALRHLKTLELHGLVTRDDQGMFSAGPEFLRLALTALEGGPTAQLIRTVEPHLRRLVDQAGESTYLAIRSDQEALYVACVESAQPIRHAGWIGRSVPLVGTAIGEALLATFDSKQPTPTFVNVGSAEPDVTAITAPVANRSGAVVGAISLIGPTYRIPSDRYQQLRAMVGDEAREVTRQLGQSFEAAQPSS